MKKRRKIWNLRRLSHRHVRNASQKSQNKTSPSLASSGTCAFCLAFRGYEHLIHPSRQEIASHKRLRIYFGKMIVRNIWYRYTLFKTKEEEIKKKNDSKINSLHTFFIHFHLWVNHLFLLRIILRSNFAYRIIDIYLVIDRSRSRYFKCSLSSSSFPLKNYIYVNQLENVRVERNCEIAN